MSGGLKDRSADLPQQGTLLPEADPNAGHRQRLKERFLAGGAETLPDYELLELVGTAQPSRIRSAASMA